MGWRLRGATVGWCCVILMSTAGTDRVGSTGALPANPDRPPASVTQPDWRPPVRTEAARRASTTTVSSTAHRRGQKLEVATPLLQAYLTAAQLVSPGCHLPVSLLAAIGQVESGNLQGRRLDARHRVVPRVLGPALDGKRFSRVPDTDGGVLDGDRRWDRAVGPMQFLPSTWIAYAVDLDGDGRLDPQDVEDAAGSAAVYLCQAGGDLAEPAALRRAVLTYNHSQDYLRLVLAWMAAYDDAGVTAGSALATLPAVLVDPGVRRVLPIAGTTARQHARARGAATKRHAKEMVADDPAGTKPTKPGRDPVRPGGGWTPGQAEPPDEEPPTEQPPGEEPPGEEQPGEEQPGEEQPPGEELPPCEVEPPAVDPVTGQPTTEPATDPSADPAPADATTDPDDPTDPPAETCRPADPNDPATPVDPAKESDPSDPDEPQDPCAPCAP